MSENGGWEWEDVLKCADLALVIELIVQSSLDADFHG